MGEHLYMLLIVLCVVPRSLCVPLSELYPFGTAASDAKLPKNDDGSSPRVTISSLFPFFNNQHNSLFVNTNGAISFLQTLSTFTPSPFPLSNGWRIIAPFWADVDIRNGGDVFYRETTNATILNRASEEIKMYFPSQVRFQAAWVFIATWDNVAFYGANSVGKTKRNTFQTVLVTNGRHSFTILNFNKVQWTTGTASNGDATTGLGGTPAQTGFNAGDGVNFYAVNVSRTSAIINVPSMSNVDHPGKFVFRIDTEKIESGGCNTGGTLTITPRHGTMLGGQKLIVSGPCLTETDNITAVYEVVDREYPCTKRSEFSMACITPFFYSTGDIRVIINVQHQDGSLSNYTGKYSILNIANTKPALIRTNPQRWTYGQSVNITWNKAQLPFQGQFGQLDIFYVIMRELTYDLQWLYGGTINPQISLNEEKFTFQLNVRIYVALFRLSPVNVTDIWHTEGVWSDVFPVVPPSSIRRTLCSTWYNTDKNLQQVVNSHVQPCPCTLRQASLDTGRFHRDPLCNSGSSSTLNCVHHGSAHHCIRLNVVGIRGTGRLCCYDKTGNLMDARNLQGGGTVHRHHYFGADGNIPFLSNFYFDMVPYLQCCVYKDQNGGNNGGIEGGSIALSLTAQNMQGNIVGDTCPKFFERRPPSDCKGYVPPRPARANGDPHMKTLDGLSYTFNGVGEYVLLRDIQNKFIVQARSEQVVDRGNKKQASVFTSVVIRTVNVSDTIEVQMNSIRIADALLNGQIVDFTETSWIDFTGGSILLLQNAEQRNDTKEILVMFTEPRVAFQVIASKYLLNVITVVSDDSLKENLEGLLGNYDGDDTNDLQSENGTLLPSNAPLQDIHHQFGERWRIKPAESLFTYPIGKTYADFARPDFVPNFVMPVIRIDLNNSRPVDRVCGTNYDCLFDLQTTGLEEIAMSTKEITDTFEQLEVAAEPVVSCGLPPGVDNGQWNTTGYTSGSTAFLNCDSGYIPSVSGEIVCGNDGEWDSKDIKCNKNQPKPSGVGIIYSNMQQIFLMLTILKLSI